MAITDRTKPDSGDDWNGDRNTSEYWKNGFLALLVLVCLGMTIFLVVWGYIGKISASSLFLKDIIILILTFTASSIIAYWFSKFSNREKVDTIAERSTEKMVYMSGQLERVKTYLEECEHTARREPTVGGAINAYRHRAQGAAELIASLRDLNEAFRADWLGVVSNRMRRLIEKKHKSLREYTDAVSILYHQKKHTDKNVSQTELQKEREAAKEKINEITKTLPVPSAANLPKTPAVKRNQLVEDGGTDMAQAGQITLTLLRPIYSAVGTGKLTPAMRGIPNVTVELVSAPMPKGQAWSFNVRVGTNVDFNINMKSATPEKPLLLGDYTFKYKAGTQLLDSEEVTNPPLQA